MEGKTKEKFVDLLDPATLPELALHVKPAFQKGQTARFLLCVMHHIDFRHLLEQHDPPNGDCFAEKLDFVLTNPPYSVRRTRHNENAVCDGLSRSDMGDVIKICKRMKNGGGHEHILFSARQLGHWFKLPA